MDRTRKKTEQQAEADRRIAQKEVLAFGTNTRLAPEELDDREVWWRTHYEELKTREYLLRPRYSPDWVPSWRASKKDWVACEDSKRLEFAPIIDATRISDGKVVTLKRINQTDHPHEIAIAQYFSSDDLAAQPENHCVPVYEVFALNDDDNMVIIVMPLLRAYCDPGFDTIGEGVEFFRQLFEGLHYMHKHNVAHRDCMSENIMLDPSELYPDSFHPMETHFDKNYLGYARHFTRTQRPHKYYLIDFGISRRYDPSDTAPREVPIWGGDREVPEFQNSNEPCNPFPTDVFYIGNVIRQDFIQSKRGFKFMQPLVADMIQADPTKRPTMDEVVARFDSICRGLSAWKLRSRAMDEDEGVFERFSHIISHWTRRIRFVARGVPAIPAPRS
ncbi:hypothetical protein PAXRUDRAFT_157549 [Paxillus rubicundulus Ve08.2h10]|uniref:Unplaced genomic scaffold scaffold_1098, whole genome shotgun sequence n=1 Tax=Paxillus rubicundulus Ve08.2h10 TaxID=930991 RepID=A0A0D0DPG7_9AGAM|nr:hypothetical protein PAXRUDRAFT_157549 [Paxillus rubicundulus Ve08.2h10]